MHASSSAERDARWTALQQQCMQSTLQTKTHASRSYAAGAWLSAIIPSITAPLQELRAPADQLEQLERELVALLAAAAPATWSANRRPFSRVLRAARRELRARERRALIGEPS